MKANNAYAGLCRLRPIRLTFFIIFLVFFIKLIAVARQSGYDSSAYRWVVETSKQSAPKPVISPPSPSSHEYIQGTSEWTGYSIKPIAYVFPQFHAIPENDKFWGKGFTEWNNVQRVKINSGGLETLRPTREIGYYNLLDYDTRKRYGDLVRDSGYVCSHISS